MLRHLKFGGLLTALVMAAGLWFYVQRILIPYQEKDAVAHGRPRGILSDIYPRWVGTRAVLLQHRDPYSEEVTREIQQGYYGRVLDPSRAGDPKDQQRFAYPVYVVFLLAPLAKLPFATARLITDCILVLLTALSVLLWLRVLRWRPSGVMVAILMILTLNSLPVVQGIKLEQLSLLVGALMALGAACVVSAHLALGGAVFAIATIKPQLSVLPIAFLLLWTVSDWRRRQWFFWGFTTGMTVLFAASHVVSPGWFARFVAGLQAYQRYTGGHSLLDELATPTGGAVLAILATAGTAGFCWRTRKVAAGSASFQHVFALVLLTTVAIVPMTAPYNQVLLLPAILLIGRSWRGLWRQSSLNRAVGLLALLLLFWPWLASLGLVLVSLVLPAATAQQAWAAPLWTSLGIPLVILPLLVLLLRSAIGQELQAGP